VSPCSGKVRLMSFFPIARYSMRSEQFYIKYQIQQVGTHTFECPVGAKPLACLHRPWGQACTPIPRHIDICTLLCKMRAMPGDLADGTRTRRRFIWGCGTWVLKLSIDDAGYLCMPLLALVHALYLGTLVALILVSFYKPTSHIFVPCFHKNGLLLLSARPTMPTSSLLLAMLPC
jgi:hypothetical protein